jgi:hypothetical protein
LAGQDFNIRARAPKFAYSFGKRPILAPFLQPIAREEVG